MGLGKTLQALSIAYYYKNEWPVLIVCPSSMRFPWIEEIEKWLPDVQPQELNLVQSGTDASNIKTSKISIVGYGLLSHSSSRLLINCLKETKFGVVIVDESHYMKNRNAARTKALVSVIKQAKRAVLLTGTPALARPEELYVQVDVLKPNLLGSFSKFANRYCEAHTEYVCGSRIRKWNTQGASNLEELHNVLKTNVMVRRLKRHVLTQLPPKRRQRITFDLAESEAKKQLAGVINEFRSVCKQIKGSSSSQSQAPMDTNPLFEMKRLATVLYRQTGMSKISAVRQYIADILDNSDKKFLVFAHHVDVMKAIEQELVKKRVKYIRIAGDVPSVLRGALVHQFQTDSSTRVAILSILAASVGITLTAADHIVFSELHWTPGVMEQAEDRVHRIGQENSVLVQYLVAKGTIDEVLWRMLCNKVYVTTTTLNGKLQGLDVEEGSERQSRLLEAFSAWAMEDEDDELSEDDFLFTHSQKKRKQDSLQRSLTEFFHSPSTSKCRKTDSGKEWPETQSSPSEEDQQCETVEMSVKSTPQTEPCIVVDSDEDNSLRKTTKKTYKIGKKKSPETNGEITTTVAATNSQEMARELAKEIMEIDSDETTEPANGDMVNMLSSYTRLLNKTKPKRSSVKDVCEENNLNCMVEPFAERESENSSTVVENSTGLAHEVADSEVVVCPAESKVLVKNISSGESRSQVNDAKVEDREKDVVSSKLCDVVTSMNAERKGKILRLSTEVLTASGKPCSSSEVSETNECAGRLEEKESSLNQSLSDGQGMDAVCSTKGKENTVSNFETDRETNIQTKNNDGEPSISSLEKQNDCFNGSPMADTSSVLKTARSEPTVNSISPEATETKSLAVVPNSLEDFKNPGTWCCSVCTFNNSAFLRMCEICETPRYRSRRKSTNTTLTTDEFVKRRQRKILEKCSQGDERSSRKKSRKRLRDKKGLLAVTRVTEESGGSSVENCSVTQVKAKIGDERSSVGVTKNIEVRSGTPVSMEDCSTVETKVKCFEDKLGDDRGSVEITRGTESTGSSVPVEDCFTPEGKAKSSVDKLGDEKGSVVVSRVTEVLTTSPVSMHNCCITEVKAKCSEDMSKRYELSAKTFRLNEETSPEHCVPESKPEKLDKPVQSCEANTSDEDIFGAVPLNEEVSDEIMTSPCETDTATEDFFGPGSEFDDITDDDWWICNSCKNYNYDDAADQCEVCGLTKAKPSEHFEDLLTDLDDDDCWRCEDCGEFNFGDDVIRKCTKCSHGDKKHKKSLVEQYKNLRHLIVDDNGSEGRIGKPEVIENLMFRLSSYTDRVYLYDENGEPLNCNVNIADMEASNTENIPAILTETSNRRQVTTFVRKWNSLQQRKRRMIRKSGIIFDDPYEALEAVKMGREEKLCTSRFPSKEKLAAEVLVAAQEANGTVRHCVKPRGRNRRGVLVGENKQGATAPENVSTSAANNKQTRWQQAMDKNGRPLCLSCKLPVDTKNTNCMWDERFCSHNCKEQYQCRISGTRVREQLFLDEKGVCQQCGCDAHELYRTIMLLPKPERRSYLEKTPFISLPVSSLNKIIIDPKEGMFWEADHVVAVVEGGGECDLENYRTLCVPCHRQVTAELRERLRTTRRKPRMAGIPDITSFFCS